MGAGPARFGLFPHIGLYPGADEELPPPAEYRQISYPSLSIRPGLGLRIHLPGRRFIDQPSLTIYPGETLTISTSTGTARTGALTARGAGQFSWARGNRHRSSVTTLVGAGVLYFTGTHQNQAGPSVSTTILPDVVTFASGEQTVPLASAVETVRLAGGTGTVRL